MHQKISIVSVLILFCFVSLQSMDRGTINHQDELGYTKLHKATSLEDALELLKLGADANIQNKYGDTACHLIMRMSFDTPTATSRSILDLLVATADFSMQNNIGNTPFHSLVRCGNMSICSPLIKSIQHRRSALLHAMQGAETLLLIHRYKGKFRWLPKGVLLRIINTFLSHEFSVYREKYKQLSLNHILKKKNQEKKRAESIAAKRYKIGLVELKNIKKHKKKYNELDYKQALSVQSAHVDTIKEIKKLLDHKKYI